MSLCRGGRSQVVSSYVVALLGGCLGCPGAQVVQVARLARWPGCPGARLPWCQVAQVPSLSRWLHALEGKTFGLPPSSARATLLPGVRICLNLTPPQLLPKIIFFLLTLFIVFVNHLSFGPRSFFSPRSFCPVHQYFIFFC